ncbi:TIGR04282 family arsenosugar biosynthesis glycosyltransferase [Azospirillum sp. SYSU D00513]|uniref:TIGR04282 family arsenosugar biosynthesis glycosyltransferase n=1 Tax=Azospirillum sp. SYSU D00513 TaxID=2812561 RepID=UPI001A9583E9|nr:TIGR04282 family arsenosugar biosynthesis glycosyltransferase [Azospirillum sp. SYSU D00513]
MNKRRTASRHLIVFARLPRLGRGKRRLAAGVGALEAWRFYRTALGELLRRLARDPRWTLWVAVTPDRGAGEGRWPAGCRPVGQGQGDLGARMARALARAPRGPAVIVGSDIPEIMPADVAAAFRALGRHDFVFGPAGDGGYWLVGARRTRALPAGLFEGVRWSSEHALADTRSTLPRRQSAGQIGMLEDVDDAAALRRWRERSRVTRHRGRG